MIFNIFSNISQFALDVIDKMGYAGIFVLSAVESAGIPIPSEVVVPFSGFLAAAGRFEFWLVVAVATTANYTGSVILYYIGRNGGRWLLERYGRYVFISRHDLEIGDGWFQRHGGKAVFFGRILPVVRTFISLPAGVARMNLASFTIFTILGALPWNFTLAYIGFKAGENWAFLHEYFRKFDFIIIGAALAVIVWYFIKKRSGEKFNRI